MIMDNDEFLKTIVDPQGIPFDTESDPNDEIERARKSYNWHMKQRFETAEYLAGIKKQHYRNIFFKDITIITTAIVVFVVSVFVVNCLIMIMES